MGSRADDGYSYFCTLLLSFILAYTHVKWSDGRMVVVVDVVEVGPHTFACCACGRGCALAFWPKPPPAIIPPPPFHHSRSFPLFLFSLTVLLVQLPLHANESANALICSLYPVDSFFRPHGTGQAGHSFSLMAETSSPSFHWLRRHCRRQGEEWRKMSTKCRMPFWLLGCLLRSVRVLVLVLRYLATGVSWGSLAPTGIGS